MREVGKTFVDKEKEKKKQYKEAIDWEAFRL